MKREDATYENLDGLCNHISSFGVDHGWYLPAGCIASSANGWSTEPFGFGWSTASLCLDPKSKGGAHTEFAGYPYEIVSNAK